jgi:hypothetical protein
MEGGERVTIVNRAADLYSRAPSLGLSEGQTHYLASLLLRSPGAELRFDAVVLTIARVGEPQIAVAMPTVPASMPFECAGSAYADEE